MADPSWHLQFNALPGALTGREVLHMYARLRGVPSSDIRNTVEELIHRIDLSEYADRCFLLFHQPLLDLFSLASIAGRTRACHLGCCKAT